MADRCALVLIDVQHFCCDREYAPEAGIISDQTATWAAYYERVNTMLANLSQLLATCRARGILAVRATVDALSLVEQAETKTAQ